MDSKAKSVKAYNMRRFLSDENLQRVTGQIFVGYGVLAAYQVGVYAFLAKNPADISDLGESLFLSNRVIQALISCSAAQGLVCKEGKKYKLTELGSIYLDPKSATYYGKVFDLLIQESQLMTLPSIMKSVQKNAPISNNGKSLFDNKDSVSNTKKFVDSLHFKALQPAFFWAKNLDLKRFASFVDLGCGSGIHGIAACFNNHHIRAILCDRPSIIEYTQEFITNYNLMDRVSTFSIDIFTDKFPTGDIYFFGDIFHDWPEEKCKFLAEKSYNQLPDGGMILIHEMLFNDEKTGPFLTSAYNMKMLLWTEGEQFGKSEIKTLLKNVGFKNVKVIPSLGNWSLVIGIK